MQLAGFVLRKKFQPVFIAGAQSNTGGPPGSTPGCAEETQGCPRGGKGTPGLRCYLRSTARQDGVYDSLASLLVAGHRASCIRTLKHQFRDGDMRTANSRQGPGAPIPATPTSQASCPLAGGSPTSSALLSWGPAFPLARSGAVGGMHWSAETTPNQCQAHRIPTSPAQNTEIVRETSPPAPLSPGDPSAPAAPHGHTPMPTQPRAVPSMPPHWGLAGPAGMRSQGAAAAEITAKSGAKSLGK